MSHSVTVVNLILNFSEGLRVKKQVEKRGFSTLKDAKQTCFGLVIIVITANHLEYLFSIRSAALSI